MKKRIAVALFVYAIVALCATAQPKENFERGFSPEKMYHFTNLDHVNLFNGNLAVTIPIGDSYSLNGGSSYSLTLVYNSKLWEFKEVTPIHPTNPPCCQSWAFPNRRSNAGFGWLLSLGRRAPVYSALPSGGEVIETYAFESPDGNDHRLNYPVSSNDSMSTDGSYYRWRHAEQELDSSEGAKRTFWPDGFMKRMTDVYGNWVNVDETFDINGLPAAWHITDSENRSHWVYFKPFAGTTPFSSSQKNYKVVVDRVVLQTAGGDVTYSFVYANDSGVVDQTTNVRGDCRGEALGWPNEYALPLLRKVVLADGSAYSDMTYISSGLNQGCAEGSLTGLTLPTKGKMAWQWGSWSFPKDCGFREWFHVTNGVRQRKFLAADGATNLGTWNYVNSHEDREWMACGDGSSQLIGQSTVTTVTTPSGNIEKNWFTAWPSATDSSQGISNSEYGHPQSRLHTDSSGTRYLSTQTFDCSSGTCPSSPTRSRYLRYKTDWENQFPRNESERTDYGGGLHAYEDREGFDGFGHFRRIESGSNFPDAQTSISFKNFNPGTDADGKINGVFKFASTDPWILGTYDYQWAKENGHTMKSLACFESSTGFLQRVRALSGDNTNPDLIGPAGDDLLKISTRDTKGNVATEQYYGGDVRPGITALDTLAPLCSVVPPSAEFEVRHTYSKGALESSRYFDGTSLMPFKSVDRTIHASGTMTAERDTSGLISSTYAFDPQGRLSTVTQSGTADTTYSYTNASYANSVLTPAEVSITRSDTSSRVQFDALGRVSTEFRTMPGVGEVRRKTTYDLEGRKSTVSEWDTSATPGHLTRYTYDGFGQPVIIITPDNSVTTLSYTGISTVERVSSVATSSTGQSQVTKTEHYDQRGRVVKVEEASGNTSASSPTGGIASTKYEYHVGGQLSKVTMTYGSDSQSRSFEYDSRGFLKSETQPEITSGVTYGDYDARGHATKRTAGGRTLKFGFDRAERLLSVSEVVGAVSKSLKEFTFAGSNNGAEPRLGKLLTAIRHNDLPSAGLIDVKETYQYDPANGEVKKRITSVEKNGTQIQSFEEEFSYDALGLPSQITMPKCSLNGCGSATTTNGIASVTLSRTNGLLTSIPGFASMTYRPSGMVGTVVHASTPAATDTYDALNNVPRPTKITFGGGQSCPALTESSINAPSAVCPNSSGNMAWVAPRSGITHSWQITGGTFTSSSLGDTITFQAGASGSVILTVTAADGCGNTASSSRTVPITTAPSASTINAPGSVVANSTGNAASVSPRSGITHTWQISGGTITSSTTGDAITFTAGAPGTLTLTVTATNTCGGSTPSSAYVTVTAPISAPAWVNAYTVQDRTIQITWAAVSGAASYQIERTTKYNGVTSWTHTVNAPGTLYTDTAPATTLPVTYVYYVRSIASGGSMSGRGAFDDATAATQLYTQPAITSQSTLIKAIDVVELRRAIDAYRDAYYQPPSFGGAGTPSGVVYATDFTALVNALNGGRYAAGKPPFSWVNVHAPEATKVIMAEHIRQIREALR